MNLTVVAGTGRERAAIVRGLDVASQLRSAVSSGDDARISRLLTELLRVKGLTKGQRVRLQQRALCGVVETLRAAALNDELTGLCNRRGFMQSAMRLLDLAVRDARHARLFHFSIDRAADDASALASVTLRQLGNDLRDLFPNYGVYEVLGRLEGMTFAALTLDTREPLSSCTALRVRTASAGEELSALHIGVALFDPSGPRSLDELLQRAVQDAALRAAQHTSSSAANGARLVSAALC
jgi:GGDEF domain-containing protein